MRAFPIESINYCEYAPRGRRSDKNILLIHGWGAYKEKLIPLAKKLKQHGWYVVGIDLPGFGQTPPPLWPFDVGDYANIVNSFCSSKFGDKNFIVFGHSFGGRVATRLSLLNPYVAGLVLCATSGLKRTHIVKRVSFLVLAKTGKIFMLIPGVEFIADVWKKLLYKTAREHDYEKTQGIMRTIFRRIVTEDIKPLLPKVNIPVLLLWGEQDKMTPLKTAYTAKELLPRSLLKTFPEVGHALPYKRPAEIARQINVWSKTFS